MKRSEVIKELLESYHFQHGKRTNKEVVEKARKLIKSFGKEETKINLK
jgi:hypothetical protein